MVLEGCCQCFWEEEKAKTSGTVCLRDAAVVARLQARFMAGIFCFKHTHASYGVLDATVNQLLQSAQWLFYNKDNSGRFPYSDVLQGLPYSDATRAQSRARSRPISTCM